MNLVQIQSQLQGLPDQILQQQLVRPSGMIPQFLVLGELQRRKEMRSGSTQQQQPSGSMAEEYARGMGQADLGNFSQAIGEAMRAGGGPPPQPAPQAGPPQGPPGQPPGRMMPQQGGMPVPQPPQGFRDGGEVEDQGFSPYMTPYQRMLAIVRRQRMLAAQGDMSLPEEADLTALRSPVGPRAVDQVIPTMEGSPVIPPTPRELSWRERGQQVFPGLPSQPSSVPGQPSSVPNWRPMEEAIGNLEGSLGRAIRRGAESLPAGPGYQESPNLRGPSQDYPRAPMLPNDPDVSLGQAIARGIQGRRLEQNVPPPPEPPPPPTAQDFGRPPERPRMGLGGVNEGPDWLNGNQFANALRQPRANLEDPSRPPLPDGPPPDRPFEGSPTRGPGMPPTGEPPVARNITPPPGLPPSGGAPMASGAPSGGALAGQPLGDIMDQFRQARGIDRYAELIDQNRARKDALKAGLEGDKGMALLAAGLGIMGGTSPYPMVNIGRGALAGVANWSDASKEMRLAERDIANADQALAIAQANRDERGVEMAFKQKAQAEENALRREDMALRRSTSGAASADAAANRAMMLKLREQEIENNKLEREERRRQTRETALSTEYNQASQNLNRNMEILKGYVTSGIAPKDDIDNAKTAVKEAQENKRKAEINLYEYRVEQGIKSGVLKDALNMTEAEIRKKRETGEWPKGTKYVTKDGIDVIQ